jgi:hypothetical protein
MLTRDETREVTDAVATVLSNEGDVRAFISTVFTGNDTELLRDLPMNLVIALQQAQFIVNYCLGSRWSKNPSMLEQLLDKLVNNYSYRFVVQLDRVRAKTDPNPDPVVALWLASHMPFFSRKLLRPVLMCLVSSDTQPILRVVGPQADGDECGKSYTAELIQHIRDARTDLRIAPARIEKGLGPSVTAEEVAMALVAPTGKELKLPERSSSSYAKILCFWILNQSMSTPDRWIYVLDGFDQPDVQNETKELVNALARELTGGEYRKRIRMVLVAYSSPLLGVPEVKILKEEVPPATAVTTVEIADCLAAHYADLVTRGQAPVPRSVVDTVAQQLVQGAPAGPAMRLWHLNDKLTKLRQDDLRQLGVIP